MKSNILNNKYRILKQLGSSKFGSSYLAQSIDHPDQQVVIKELSNLKEKMEEDLLKKISFEQPGIQRFLDSFSENQKYYQVFEYIPEAISLRQLIDNEAPFDEKQAITVGLEISKILKTFHAHGLVHGDIKPSNILITPEKHVKLIDFEITSLNGKKNSIGIGTEEYSAPEQHHGIINFKNDIYSLGVVLYEMLTGRRSKRRFSFEPIQMINRNVSFETIKIIQKCLELAQTKRPSTDEVHNALLSLTNDRNN